MMATGHAKWPTVKLADVAEQCLGKMLDAKKNKGRLLPYLRNPDVRWFDVDTSNLQMMPFEDHEDERYGLMAGDIVVCEGGEAGRAAIWDGRLPELKFQKAIHRVRPGPRLHNRYFVHQLLADHQSGRLADYFTGATIKHLTGQDLARYEFPLPPLTEQLRIAEVLDRAEALRAKRRAALAQLDTLTQAIFLDMFGDPATNPNGWPEVALSACTRQIQIGPFGSLLHEEDYVAGGIPLINPKHIQGGAIVPDPSESVAPGKYADLRLYMLRHGDVVMGRRGEMGRCAIVGPEHDGLLCGTGSLFIRPDVGKATALYLTAVLSSSAVRRRLERLSIGTTLPNLNRTIVEALLIPMPPNTLQKEFARAVTATEELRVTHRTSLTELDALFASLQHRAFRGEL